MVYDASGFQRLGHASKGFNFGSLGLGGHFGSLGPRIVGLVKGCVIRM